MISPVVYFSGAVFFTVVPTAAFLIPWNMPLIFPQSEAVSVLWENDLGKFMPCYSMLRYVLGDSNPRGMSTGGGGEGGDCPPSLQGFSNLTIEDLTQSKSNFHYLYPNYERIY